MKKFLISLSIFVTCTLFAEGFPPGTIVHCLSKDVPIEYIKQWAPVFSFDSDGNHCIEHVLEVAEKSTDTFIRLQAEGEYFFATPDQLFLLSNNTWKAAAHLVVGDKLQRVGGTSAITDYDVIDAGEPHAQVYTLFISGTQNFSITKYGFYVHNVVPVAIVVGGLAAKTATAIFIEKATEAAIVTGIGLGAAYLHSKHQDKMREKRNSSATTGGGGQPPEPPDRPGWKKTVNPTPNFDNKEAKKKAQQLWKSRHSLEQQAKKHTKKLADYKKNPYAWDHKGFLKNKTPERIEHVIKTRIESLGWQIKNFEEQIIQIDRDLADLGCP